MRVKPEARSVEKDRGMKTPLTPSPGSLKKEKEAAK